MREELTVVKPRDPKAIVADLKRWNPPPVEIGKVHANAEHEEDWADQTLIEMGAIAGDGLLGVVVEAVDKLVEASADRGYYGEGSAEGVEAADKIEKAWVKLFAALKAIEEVT